MSKAIAQIEARVERLEKELAEVKAVMANERPVPYSGGPGTLRRASPIVSASPNDGPRIASIALVTGATLLTRNLRDFRRATSSS
jgi:predicted nucleic acid-binding protein